MSDRIKGFIVVLDKDYREEDIENLRNAILQMKGVVKVKDKITTADDYIVKERTLYQIKDKLYNFIEEIK